MKTLIFSALANRALIARRTAKIKKRNLLTIVNLHRIAPFDGSAYRPLGPGIFEAFLGVAKRHFTLTTFQKLESIRHHKPLMVLSFDDGYKDFIDYAVPIMEKHGVSANQNIIPGCIETGLPPLNVVVQDYWGKVGGKTLRDLNWPGIGKLPEDIGPGRLSFLIKNKPKAEQAEIANVVLPHILNHSGFTPTQMMSRAETREISALHEFGAHSFEHASMAVETDEYLQADVRRCRQYFDTELEVQTNIYAFPNGSHRDTQPDILKGSGFTTILGVGNKFSSVEVAGIHPRFGVTALSLPELIYKATGRLNPLVSEFKS